MTIEQAGTGQPEVKSYESELQDDTRAAFEEVTKGATRLDTPVEEPVETKPEEVVEDKPGKLAGRERDEQGRLLPKKADKPTEKEVKLNTPAEPIRAGDDKTQPALAAQAQPAQAEKLAPPPGLSNKAISQWEKLPQIAREELTRLASSAMPADLKTFHERAQSMGQTLAQALQSYTGIEDLIRRDVGAGLMHIVQNTGLTQHQAGQLFLGLASRLGAMPTHAGPQPASNGHDASQANPDLNQVLAPFVSPLQQRIDQLEGIFRQQNEAIQGQRLQGASHAVEQFRQSAGHEYFDNLEGQINDILEKGIVPLTGDYASDLQKAYDLACNWDPEVREILSNQRLEKLQAEKAAKDKEAAEKARQASRSVTGSPSVGNPSGSSKKTGLSYDEDLQNDVIAALRQHSGRV